MMRISGQCLGGDEESFNSFKGFLGSRLRKLVERLGYLPCGPSTSSPKNLKGPPPKASRIMGVLVFGD